jgi:DNA-binding NtrC family response regulator
LASASLQNDAVSAHEVATYIRRAHASDTPSHCHCRRRSVLSRALARWLYAVGWHTVTFASAAAFRQTDLQLPPQCLILDVRLPGMSGVELVEYCVVMGLALPVIIICAAAHGRAGPAASH